MVRRSIVKNEWRIKLLDVWAMRLTPFRRSLDLVAKLISSHLFIVFYVYRGVPKFSTRSSEIWAGVMVRSRHIVSCTYNTRSELMRKYPIWSHDLSKWFEPNCTMNFVMTQLPVQTSLTLCLLRSILPGIGKLIPGKLFRARLFLTNKLMAVIIRQIIL